MKLVFVFPGHGTQRWNMGRQLLEQEPVFRATVQKCSRLSSRYTSWSLWEELLAEENHSRLDSDHVEITQTAIFSIQVALSALWRSRGVQPDAVVGYSMGEVASAHEAGILSLHDAIRVILSRSRLLHRGMRQAAQKGGMALVRLSRKEVEQLLNGYRNRLWIAAHNSPKMTALGGEAAALEEFTQSLKKKRIGHRLMRTPGAGHTPQIELIRKELVQALDGIQPQPASTPVFSTVTGKAGNGPEFNAEYWGRQVKEPILFSEAMDHVLGNGYDTFLEISPDPILLSSISHCLRHHGRRGLVLASLRRNKMDREALQDSLDALLAGGFIPRYQLPEARDTIAKMAEIAWRDTSVNLEGSVQTNMAVPTTYSARLTPRERKAGMDFSDRRTISDRRSGIERRRSTPIVVVSEMRSGPDRRNGAERRKSSQRRAASV